MNAKRLCLTLVECIPLIEVEYMEDMTEHALICDLFADSFPLFRSHCERYTPERVDTMEHRALALVAAQQGMVLLKNDNSALPLKKGGTLAVARDSTSVC